ncbi:hypothetical protein, partial [Klebsiella variicola]
MHLRRISPGLKTQLAFGMIFVFGQTYASAAAERAQQSGGV